jgi:hypothetical protein
MPKAKKAGVIAGVTVAIGFLIALVYATFTFSSGY